MVTKIIPATNHTTESVKGIRNIGFKNAAKIAIKNAEVNPMTKGSALAVVSLLRFSLILFKTAAIMQMKGMKNNNPFSKARLGKEVCLIMGFIPSIFAKPSYDQ